MTLLLLQIFLYRVRINTIIHIVERYQSTPFR